MYIQDFYIKAQHILEICRFINVFRVFRNSTININKLVSVFLIIHEHTCELRLLYKETLVSTHLTMWKSGCMTTCHYLPIWIFTLQFITHCRYKGLKYSHILKHTL